MRTRTLAGLSAVLTAGAMLALTTASRTRAAREAHRAGYRQGLEHAALGLLLEPSTSTRMDDDTDRKTE